MPRTGLFARVLEGGELMPGASVEVVHRIARSVIQAAVVTISESSAAGAAFYTGAPALSELLRAGLQARIAWTQTIPGEIELVSTALKELCDRRVDLVITIGSAGISARDVAPEATRNVVDRGLAEIVEAMRAASVEEDSIALLTPAVGGARRETLIVNLSGSLNSAMESLNAILPALPDAVKILRGETAHSERAKERLLTI
jgi:molybdenum cofactor synthesis domain-containing protein